MILKVLGIIHSFIFLTNYGFSYTRILQPFEWHKTYFFDFHDVFMNCLHSLRAYLNIDRKLLLTLPRNKAFVVVDKIL
jgi:hypothetical protein